MRGSGEYKNYKIFVSNILRIIIDSDFGGEMGRLFFENLNAEISKKVNLNKVRYLFQLKTPADGAGEKLILRFRRREKLNSVGILASADGLW